MKQVLIVSHADGDGHVIAEQLRRNLSAVPTFEIETVVDPARTRDHKTWRRLGAFPEIEPCELVFFVDLMFAPDSFAGEADALAEFAIDHAEKRFFVLDHHPLPLRRLRRAPNVRPVYRSDVADCTFGKSSWLMSIAATLEKQPTRINPSAEERTLAEGIKRAAAIGGPLSGEKLLALLRFDRWDDLRRLGKEDRQLHHLPRGLRPTGRPLSDQMISLDKLASRLLASSPATDESSPGRRSEMSCNLDTASDREPPAQSIVPYESADLEAITMVLELAGLYLTTSPESSFSTGELLEQAREIGGNELEFDEKDVKIVLGKAGFLRKAPGGKLQMK